MALVKHTCSNPDCKWEGVNDKPSTPDVCPWCGWEVRHDPGGRNGGENDTTAAVGGGLNTNRKANQ